MIRAVWVRSLAALVLAALTSSAWSAETRVYRAQHRAVSELQPLAEAALGDEGRVAVDARTGSLVLVGSTAALDRAVAVLRGQDRAVETVIVDYWLEDRAALDADDLRVDWALEVGGFRIGRLGTAGTGVSVALRSAGSTSVSKRSGSLRLLSGSSGSIVTGDAIPFVTGTAYATSTNFVRAESGFEAHASVLGSGKVALELRPFDGRFVEGGVRYTAAATELILTPGETVVVASIGHESGAKQVDRLGGISEWESDEAQVLFVSVSVEEPWRR